MKTNAPVLNVILLDERWDDSWDAKISQALEKASEILDRNFSNVEVSIVFTNDQHVQELNRTFRHRDAPTNVLSFNAEIEGELGDIILAHETVMREAQEAHIPPLHHTLHLIIHGFLHLLGYDHVEENEAVKMESMEIRILETLGIKNPYEGI